MDPLVYVFGLVFLIVVCEIIGQYHLKEYEEYRTSYYLFISFASYFIISLLLTVSYNFRNIGFVNNMWCALSIIVFTIFGYYFWEETVTQNNIIGICIILSGVVLLTYDSYLNDDE
jgi:multidrug transporter EmrE-like cation transporter